MLSACYETGKWAVMYMLWWGYRSFVFHSILKIFILKIKILKSTPKRKPRAYYTCTRKKPFRWVGFTDMTYIKQQLSRELYGITYVWLQMVRVQLTMMLTVSTADNDVNCEQQSHIVGDMLYNILIISSFTNWNNSKM